MTFGKKFGIAAAMEEIDASEEVSEEVVEMPEDEETVEDGLVEIVEADAQAEQGADSIEQAVNDAESLADVADSIEATEENGGMDENAAAIAEVAVEALLQRLQVKRSKTLPALESFGSQSSRLKATSIAVESIRETLKKVWQAIYNMMIKVADFLKTFFKSIFDTNVKIKARAEKLLKAVGSLEGAAANSTFEAKGIAGNLSIGGSVDPKDLISRLKATKETLVVMSAVNSFMVEIAKKAGDAEKLVSDADAFDNFVAPELNTGNFVKAAEGQFGDAPEGLTYFTTGEEQAGNKVMVYLVPDKTEAGAASFAAVSKIKVSLEKFDPKQELDIKVPTLDFTQMEDLLKATIVASDALTAVKGETAAIEAAYKEMIAAAKTAAANAKDDKDASARSRTVQRYVSAVANVSNRPVVLVAKMLVSACNGSMDYVVKSAAQYKGPKVEAAATEPTAA